jgi:signal transduction histidine kinase/CheY-like chemotaxis protein
MALPLLSEFLLQVPVFGPRDSLWAVAEVLASAAADYGIVLSPGRQPLGLVRASRLLKTLIAQAGSPGRADLPAVETDPLCLSHHPEWIEPVHPVINGQPLAEEFATVVGAAHLTWVVVDSQQAYLGVLDRVRLTPFLTQESARQPLPLATSKIACSEGGRDGRPYPALLQSLIQQMPLPLLLQATDGEMLFCNPIWANQVALYPSAVEWPSPNQWQPLDHLPVRADLPLQSLLAALAQECPRSGPLQALETASLTPLAAPASVSWQLLRFLLSSRAIEQRPADSARVRWTTAALPSVLAVERSPLATLPSQPDSLDLWLVLALPVRAGPGSEPVSELTSAAPKAAWLLELNHELKSPLTSLLGLSALLQDPRLGTLNPRQSRYAQLLHQTSRRLSATINQLLDWFRLDAGQLALFPTEVVVADLGPQISRSLQVRGTSAEEAMAVPTDRFTWSLAAGVTALVADPLRLQQMLQHLISYTLGEADDHTNWGLQVEAWGRWVALTVWADGPSLASELQAQLFQDGYRWGQAGTPPAGKTDLGMMLTWHLARLHGGDLTFRSFSPQGTRFTLLLPQAAPAQAPRATSSTTAPPPAAPCKLLLLASTAVDNLAAVALPLEGTAYRLAVARSYAELLDKARRLEPDLILVDAQSLPVPFREAVQQLNSIPLVWLTPEDSAAAVNLPADAVALSFAHLSERLLPYLHQRLSAEPATGAQPTAAKLTILHLSELAAGQPGCPDALGDWLHDFPCRVLEVDDLGQAEVLCRVWKPHVVLLDPSIVQVDLYLARLAQLPSLRTRPLVTLTSAITQAACQWSQLQVFPCHEALSLEPGRAAALLLQVVSAAAAGGANGEGC